MSNLDFDPGAFIENEQRQVTARALNVIDSNPDDAVRAMDLSRASGVPAPVIAGDLENYDKQTKSQLASQLLQSNEYLRDYIAKNPLGAQVSNDDYGQLDSVSAVLKKMPLPVPGLLGAKAGQATSVLGKAIDAFKEAFGADQLGKEYIELGEYLAQTPGFGNIFVRHATQAAGGAVAAGLRGLGGLVAGASAAVGEVARQTGVSEAWSNRLARDAYVLANVAIPELAGLSPVAASFNRAVAPYIADGKVPPPGVHPIVDQFHIDQADLDLANLQEALRESVGSATRERAPDLFADYVRQITDGDIGVSADAITALYGDKVPAPDDGILGWVPRLQEQLSAAKATGGDVQIPIADWLARVEPEVAKQLEEFIRVRPEGVTKAEAVQGFEAFHGSPHEFEAFSMEAIGTGEGAQSYGHGLYFAEEPRVAQNYARTVDGKPRFVTGVGTLPAEGNLYRVRIRRDPAEFLDWDKPLSEQPEFAAKVQQIFAALDMSQHFTPNLRGSDVYKGLSDRLPKTQVSELLAEAGIPGVKYLDQGSRGRNRHEARIAEIVEEQDSISAKGVENLSVEEMTRWEALDAERQQLIKDDTGTRNFVLFSADDVEIITRNGEAIRQVREAAGLRPLEAPPEAVAKAGEAIGPELPLDQREAFAKAAAIGMTVDQYARYQGLIARQAAEDVAAVAKKVMEEERLRQSKDWKAKREAMRPEVVDSIRAQPDFAADRLLREGRLGDVDVGRVRINPEFLTPEARELLPRQYMAKDGASPAELAEMVGYPSGESFLQGLLGFVGERRQTGLRVEDFNRRLVDAELDRRMEAQYGSLSESVLEAAKERVLAETQVQMLHEETLALATKAGLEFSISKEQLAAALRQEFDGLLTKDVSSDRFLATAGKAGREAEMALLKGDAQGAFLQKQRQYNSIVMAKLAKEFEAEAAALDRLAKRYEGREVKGVDPATRFYIQGLLQPAGYRVRLLPDEIAREIEAYGHGTLSDFVAYKESSLWDPVVADWLQEQGPKSVDAMTTEEFRAFKDAIDSLNHIGREEMKIEILGEKMEFAAWKAEAFANLAERPIRDEAQTRAGGSWLYRLDSPWTRMEEVFKDLDLRKELGPFYNALIVPFEKSKTDSYNMLKELSAKLEETKGFGKEWQRSWADNIPQDFIYDNWAGAPFKLTRWNMIKMMLNWGNESNAGKLVDGIAMSMLERGEKLTADDRAYTRAKIEELFQQHARKEDWDFVQKMWDIFEGFRPRIERLQRSTSGVPVKWVPIREVATPHGVYRGGYIPLIPDTLQNIAFNGEAERPVRAGAAGPNYFRATTNQSHLIGRTGARYFVDITTGPEQLIGRFQQTIHDLAFREFLIDAGKVTYDPEVKNMIKKHYGVEYQRQMDPWLKNIANQATGPEQVLQGWASVAHRLNLNLIAAALPLNYAVNLSPSMGLANLHQLVKFNANRAANKALVMENSKEIPHLLYSLDRDINDALDRSLGTRKWTEHQARVMEVMFKPLMWAEQQFRMATFYEEFNKQKALGKTDYEASVLADSRIRERHSVSHIGDVPPMLATNNPFMKMWTLFMGYASSQRNWLRQTPDLARRHEYGEMAKAIWGTLGILTLMNAAFFVKKKEDEGWGSFAARSVLTAPLWMVPFVRDVWGYFSEGYRTSTPPVALGIAIGELGKDGYDAIINKKRPKRLVKHAFTAAGIGLGFPGAIQVGRTAQFGVDVATGEQKPRDIIEWIRGIATGEARLKRR